MKKLIILFVFFSLISSCTKKEETKFSNEMAFKYSKLVNIHDAFGNHAIVQISANDLDKVNEITENDLELKTTTKPFNVSGNVDIKVDENDAKSNKDMSKYVFIDIIEKDLADDVTGYSVQLKENFIQKLESRCLNCVKYYAYGSDGVRGAFVIYLDEERSSCRLDVDLDKLKTSSSWWYTGMADAVLHDPEETFFYCQSTEYYKYRLTIDMDGWHCGWVAYEYYWVIGCFQ